MSRNHKRKKPNNSFQQEGVQRPLGLKSYLGKLRSVYPEQGIRPDDFGRSTPTPNQIEKYLKRRGVEF